MNISTNKQINKCWLPHNLQSQSVSVPYILQWQRIVQFYLKSRCWARSPPKSYCL